MAMLLIEDDVMIGDSLSRALKQTGYVVNWVRDGELAQEALATQDYDLILLDLGLPGRNGIAILNDLRAKGKDTPVMIITARDTPEEIALGLDSGADDYLVKPFNLVELEARIRALMRRKSGQSTLEATYGALTLNPSTRQLRYKEKTILLSVREFALMQALMENPDAILSRAQLEEQVYGWNEEVESNAVEVHIHNLRRKLGSEIIRNVRGLGYMIGNV